MRSRLPALLVATGLVAACTASGAKTGTSTTTTSTARPTTSTTTTTLGATADPAFHTRRVGVLTVATDQAEAPYFTIDATTGAAYDGFEYDVARALATRLGLGKVRVIRGTIGSIQAGYDCGCDVYLGGVAVTEALARRVDLSVPYVDANPTMLVRAATSAAASPATSTSTSTPTSPPTSTSTSTPTPTAAELAVLRWALAATDADAAAVVAGRIKPVPAAQHLPSYAAAIHAVAVGEADAALVPAPIALLAAKADPTLAVVGRFDTGTGWAAVEPLGSANSPSLNDLLVRLTNDGTLAFISRRHLGVDPATLPKLG